MYLAIPNAPIPVLDSDVLARLQKFYPEEDISKNTYIKLASHTPAPRMLKCHCSLSLLPLGALRTSKVKKLVLYNKKILVYMFIRASCKQS